MLSKNGGRRMRLRERDRRDREGGGEGGRGPGRRGSEKRELEGTCRGHVVLGNIDIALAYK